MNREIKFRVWDRKEKKMIYYSPDVEEYDLVPFLTLAGEFVWIEYGDRDWIDRDEAVIMQYIGIKDRNGKEIYEGDMVYNGNGYRKVDWVGTGFRFVDIYGGGEDIEPTANEVKNWEVVGNIFEDAEFFNKKI